MATPKKRTLAELEVSLEAIKKEISITEYYLSKARSDFVNFDVQRRHFLENSRYLRKHEGIIYLDTYRNSLDRLKKSQFFLTGVSNDIAKFENIITTKNKELNMIISEIEEALVIEDNKIIPFRRKYDV